MRYYLDTEFNSFGGELMSIGVAPADPSVLPFYCVVEWKSPTDAWVAQNVVPHLGPSPRHSRRKAAEMLAVYLGSADAPDLVADWPTDFSLILDLLITGPGEMVAAPEFSMQFVHLRGFNTANHSAVPHNALADAEAMRDYCERLGKWADK